MALMQNVIGRGTHAARPAAGSQGVLWFETDTGQLFRDSGSVWQLVDLSALFATKGDLLVGTGSGTVAKLAAGTDTYVLTADSAQTDGIKWAAAGAASLTTASVEATGNVTVGSTSTWIDVISFSLAAGTWLVWASAEINPTNAADCALRIYDGTTVHASGEATINAGWKSQVSCVSDPFVLGSTTTVKMQTNCASTGTVKYQTTQGTQGPATHMRAIKVG